MNKLLYEGKAKRLYSTESGEELIQEFKDDATAFNGLKKDKIAHKGELNNKITSIIFEHLQKEGIPTHFIRRISDTEMLVRRVDIIKAEVVCRNIAAGSLVKKLGFTEGAELDPPIVELYLKSDELGDPLFTEQHVTALGIASAHDLSIIKEMSLRINVILKSFFADKGIRLIDFKLEFGKLKDGSIVLADEISPDTCRLWDSVTGKILDKDRFRFDLGDVEGAYKEIMERVS